MNTQTTLGEVRHEILRQKERKVDYVTNLKGIEIQPNGRLIVKARQRYDDGTMSELNEAFESHVSPNAMSQYYTMLNIPVGYATRTPFELMRPHIEYAMTNVDPEQSILLRGVKGFGESEIDLAHGVHTRALLSTKYGIIDNDTILNDLISVFGEDTQVRGYHSDNYADMLNLRVIDTEHSMIGLDPSGKSNPFYGGFHVTNGETGRFSLSLSALIFEQWCTNGAVREKFGESLLRMRHLGSSVRLTGAFENASRMLPGIYNESMDSFIGSQSIQVNQPLIALYNLMKSNGNVFSDKLSKETLYSFDRRNESTRYGIASAITEAAQKVDAERRLRAEKLAGNILFFNAPLDSHGDLDKIKSAVEEIKYKMVEA